MTGWCRDDSDLECVRLAGVSVVCSAWGLRELVMAAKTQLQSRSRHINIESRQRLLQTFRAGPTRLEQTRASLLFPRRCGGPPAVAGAEAMLAS